MTTVTRIRADGIEYVLAKLLDRNVKVLGAQRDIQAHEDTFRGLVTDENELVGLVAADLAFAHATGAALAMVPAAKLEELDELTPDEELIEFYVEVANVLSRIVNEAAPERVRIDPGLEHSVDAMLGVMDSASGIAVTVAIEGYGSGTVSLWSTR